MIRKTLSATLAVAALCAMSTAHATVFNYFAILSGPAESPKPVTHPSRVSTIVNFSRFEFGLRTIVAIAPEVL